MPAPLVYVFAAVATVGTIWAFKQFVYDPHLRDHVVTWVEELQENRRRRGRGMTRPHSTHSDDSEDDEGGQPLIPMRTAEQLHGQHSLRRRRQQSGGGMDSDEERYGIRDTPRGGSTSSQPNGFELPDLAPEVREWGRASRSPLDETNHTIPFVSLQPSRRPSGPTHRSPTLSPTPTHVIANADSPMSTTAATTPTGTPSMDRRMQALPQIPPPADSSMLFLASDDDDEATESEGTGSPAHTDLSSLVTSPPLPTLPPVTHITPTISLDISRHLGSGTAREPESTPTTASFATPVAATPLARPILPSFPSDRTLSSSSSNASTSPTSYRQTFPAQSPDSSRNVLTRSPPNTGHRRQDSSSPTSPAYTASPPLRPAFVPSLSQIYPQDLDAEHNVVLLSPPSSRSESPFSVVSAASPAYSPSVVASAGNYRSPLIEQSAHAGGSEPRTPGSTTTSYLSLTSSTPSSPVSTPTSPFVPLGSTNGRGHRGGSDGEDGSEFDFDFISDTTSVSALNSPTNPSSPFSMSPFASPRMGGPSVRQIQDPATHYSPPNRTQQQQHGAHVEDTARPTSPAASTTSTTSLSELELVEHDDALWDHLTNAPQRQGTLRRFPGRGPTF